MQRIVAKPEMGLKTCWLLQDALLEERNTLEAGSFGDVLFFVFGSASNVFYTFLFVGSVRLG